MKKKLMVVLTLILALTMVVGCSGEADTEVPDNQESSSSDEAVVIQIAYGNQPGEPIDLAANEWARLVEERSGGTMKVEVFPSAQLGSKSDVIDQMLAGDNVITIADGGFLADRGAKDLGILFAPYVFDSWDDVWRLTESDWYKEQLGIVEGTGLKVLTSNWMYGDRHTLTTKKVETVSDLEGLKIRVPNSIIQIKGMEVLGATPTPMAFGEIYTGLQQGVVDGVENPLGVLYNGKFHEVAKYLILDAHIKNFSMWVGGMDMFNSLTPEQQELLMTCGDEAGMFNNSIVEEANQKALDDLVAEGVEIIEIDKQEFIDASQAFYELEEITKDWTPGLLETVKDAMK